MVTISNCTTKRELKLFERIPEGIHQADPYFVPPFPGSVVKLIRPDSAFCKVHGKIFPMIAYQNDKPVGRIAAIINKTHNQYYDDKVGFFGYFDAVNDPLVAKLLFEAAEQKLASEKRDSMRGPYNPSINDECGVLVNGFESSPMVMMTYNPEYYLDIYQSQGFEPARDLSAYYLKSDIATRFEKMMTQLSNRMQKRDRIHLRNIDLNNLKKELVSIRDLYNVTLNRNWGFVPVTLEDLELAAEDLRSIADPNMVIFAEKDGETVGYCMALPNINEFLWKARKSSPLMRILKVAWNVKTSSPREARIMAMGVHPDFRKTGIAALFYYEMIRRGKNRFVGGELSWIDQDNDGFVKSILKMGGEKYKTYRIYQKPITLH